MGSGRGEKTVQDIQTVAGKAGSGRLGETHVWVFAMEQLASLVFQRMGLVRPEQPTVDRLKGR